jgi:hypothetical protein
MKIQAHGILIDRRPLKISCIVTEGKLNDIGHQLENSASKFVRNWHKKLMFGRKLMDSN